MLSYYRRFINNFGQTASCLFKMTRIDAAFIMTDKTLQAFETLSYCLLVAPIPIFPDFLKNFEIFCDASKFASRQLNKHEINWITSEKEILAIFWALRYYKCYIYGRFVVFYTDHEPLEKLKKSREPDGRLYSMYLKLHNSKATSLTRRFGRGFVRKTRCTKGHTQRSRQKF